MAVVSNVFLQCTERNQKLECILQTKYFEKVYLQYSKEYNKFVFIDKPMNLNNLEIT